MMNYVQFYARRIHGSQSQYGGLGCIPGMGWACDAIDTSIEVMNPVSAAKTYHKKGVSRVFREAKEEVAESGMGVFNPLKSVADRKREDQAQRQYRAQQRKSFIAAEKRKIDAAAAREKAQVAKLVAADDIPDHLRTDDRKKDWKTYVGYSLGGILGVGVLYYGQRYFYQRKKVEQ